MPLIDSLLGNRQSSAVSLPPWDDFWFNPRVPPTHSGVEVSEETSMTFSTVFSCTNKLAKTVATLPFHVLEPTGDTGSTVVEDHWLSNLWQTMFSEEVLAIPGREAEMGSRILWGNSYNEIVWADRLQTEAASLIPLLARWIRIKRIDGGSLLYEYNAPGEDRRVIPADRMLHIPGLTFNGIVGLSVIGLQRETIGMGMAAVRHGASFFGNGAIAGVVLERPEQKKQLDRDAAKKIVQDWDDKYVRGGAYRTALLEEGTTARILGMGLKDAQFLESRQFQRIEICGMFDVPPSKIQDDSRSTFTNVEQKNIDWKTDSILPHCIRIEMALKARFLNGTNLFVKHNLEGLVRGDTMARAELYTSMIRVGVPVNVILGKENLPGIGPDGDVSLVSQDLAPLAMVVSGETMNSGGQEGFNVAESFAPMFLDAAQRIVGKEVKAVGNAWKRFAKTDDAEGFDMWLEQFYVEHQEFTRRAIEPVLMAAGATTPEGSYGADHPAGRRWYGYFGVAWWVSLKYIGLSVAAIRDCIKHDPAGVPNELTKWQTDKPGLLAQQLAQLFQKEKTNDPT